MIRIIFKKVEDKLIKYLKSRLLKNGK